MKKISTYLLLCSVVFLFNSCKKWEDFLHHHPVSLPCQIKQVQFVADPSLYGDYNNRVIYFNTNGEPESSIPAQISTGVIAQHFYYNGKGWLSKLDVGEKMHFYAHDAFGNIIADTLYNNLGPIDSLGTPSLYYYSTSVYQYDVSKRITKKVTTTRFGEVSERVYEYGSDGNLRGYTYDSQLSFKRLSKVIMFLTEDYSVNNRIASTTDAYPIVSSYEYNAFHLPSKVKGPLAVPEIDDSPSMSGTSSIEYTCTK